MPGSPELVKREISCKVWSQGGTPVAGSDKIELPEWKSGLPTPVQGLSPNSTAFTLLEGFTKGNIQMQGEAVRHLQEGNLARLRNITIELMEPDGRILGTIKNVNFLEKQNKKIEENTLSKPTISEILGGLELDQELIGENIADVCSMGKQKWGRLNPTKPSPASKVVKKKKKDKDQEKLGSTPKSRQGMSGKSTPEAGRQEKAVPEKSKSGLGSSDKTTLEARETKKVMLKANPRINPETGVPQTTEVEREAIWRLLERRGRGQTTPTVDSSSSSEEETNKKKRKGEGEEPGEEETKRRMAKDLVAKKKTGGGASKAKKKSWKGATVASWGKVKKALENKTPQKKVSSRADSGRKYGGMSGGTPAVGLSWGPGFYHTDEQGRTFDRYGKRIYVEGETQTVIESSDDDLGVQPLEGVFGMVDTDDSDDDETLAEMQKKEAARK